MLAIIVSDGFSSCRARVAHEPEPEGRSWRNFREVFAKTSDTPLVAVLAKNAITVAGVVVGILVPWVLGGELKPASV
ncbi:hypothetical protein OB919_05315 [Halobacteria archaeon AArc-curdl1]|uniref:Uncharacterized protein n=1 Tax=Natronosalvus hydrolyticus TaxID=2979988 RepID=A0AAP2Z6C4_9EURY|nr:hypothetical protein [Halobacteria archaeon AArc-curdl1]